VQSDLAVSAIKTGMLGDTQTVEIVAELLSEIPGIPVIVDPVMVATSGDVLLAPEAIDAVRRVLIPRALLITPNIPEAARLLDVPPAASEEEMMKQAGALAKFGARAVLVKGGHGEGEEAVDILFDGSEHRAFRLPMIATRNTHGTGCTLSAAIAAYVGLGLKLDKAVEAAKLFVWNALEAGSRLRVGHGNGPVDHLSGVRKSSDKS